MWKVREEKGRRRGERKGDKDGMERDRKT